MNTRVRKTCGPGLGSSSSRNTRSSRSSLNLPHLHIKHCTAVDRAADLIMSSKSPLILLGSQATLPPIKPQKLRQTLESLGIPCYLGGMCRGMLGRNGKLHIRQNRRDALNEADVVLLAGSVCDFRLSYGRVLNRKSKIIAVNRNKQQLYRNSDMFWKPELAVQSDAGVFLTRLFAVLERRGYKGCATDWLLKLQNRDKAKEEKNAAAAENKPDKHLNVVRVLMELEKSLPDDAILVADGGDFVGTAAYTVRARGPLQWLDPGAFGTLGVGGGFALGAKLVHPDKPVWILYGDGSFGYSLIEFDTYQRHKLPVVAIIGNDGCWSQIEREQTPMFGTSVGCDLTMNDYGSAVKAFGAVDFKLDEENESETSEVFAKVHSQNMEGKNVLLNVLIGKSTFRQGSISV